MASKGLWWLDLKMTVAARLCHFGEEILKTQQLRLAGYVKSLRLTDSTPGVALRWLEVKTSAGLSKKSD